jgi:hypothetical protein
MIWILWFVKTIPVVIDYHPLMEIIYRHIYIIDIYIYIHIYIYI